MAWIQVIPQDEAEGRLKEYYDRIQDARGKIANIVRVHSLNPEAMKAHLDLYMTLMFNLNRSGLSRAQREMLGTLSGICRRRYLDD